MKRLLPIPCAALFFCGCLIRESSEPPKIDPKPTVESSIDLDDPDARERILASALGVDDLQMQGAEGEKMAYASGGQTLFTGWVKLMHDPSQVHRLIQYKEGKMNGLGTLWYKNGQKRNEGNFKDGKRCDLWIGWYENGQEKLEGRWQDGKLLSAMGWKPTGEICPVTNVTDGNGVVVWYNDDGTEILRYTYQAGEVVED